VHAILDGVINPEEEMSSEFRGFSSNARRGQRKEGERRWEGVKGEGKGTSTTSHKEREGGGKGRQNKE